MNNIKNKNFEIKNDLFGNKWLICETISENEIVENVVSKDEQRLRINIEKDLLSYYYEPSSPIIVLTTTRQNISIYGIGEELDEVFFKEDKLN